MLLRRIVVVMAASSGVLAAPAAADTVQRFQPRVPDPGPGRVVPDGRGLPNLVVTMDVPGARTASGDLRAGVWTTAGPCRERVLADAWLSVRRPPAAARETRTPVALVDERGVARTISARLSTRPAPDADGSVDGALVVRLPPDVLPALPHRHLTVLAGSFAATRAPCPRPSRERLRDALAGVTITVAAPFVAPAPLDLPPAVDPRAVAATTIRGARADATAGDLVVALGDVDGDARPDLAVGDRYGVSVVSLSRRDRVIDLADEDAAAVHLRDARSIAPAGDVDADGRDDLVVGIPGARHRRGVVRLRTGGGTARLTVVGPQPCAGLGSGVAAPGDVDGDGAGDLVVVAEGCGERPRNRAWIVYGDRGAVDLARPGTRAAPLTGLPRGRGVTVAGAGDVDGDGLADAVVGAPSPSGAGATIVLGARERTRVDLRAPGARGIRVRPAPCEEVGGTVAPGGDVNGDGLDDVLLSASLWCDRSPFGWGGAYVIFGGPATTVRTTALGDRGIRLDGLRDQGREAGIASAGDQDGDGLDDVLVGDGREVLMVPARAQPGVIDLRTLGSTGRRFRPIVAGVLGDPALASIPDVDGDARPELVLGDPLAGSGQRRASGRVLVVPSSVR
ncbi:MAG TPA: FG-GAP-like repeat-containing protein [Capillimicrobium sp.]|nr:FG-GAP-like repeat-containing protein [Capillimicrobium sp.]